MARASKWRIVEGETFQAEFMTKLKEDATGEVTGEVQVKWREPGLAVEWMWKMRPLFT